jgi:hypothetical protein
MQTVVRQCCPLNLRANQCAVEAHRKAKAKGWEVWTAVNQSDVLDYATCVARIPGTSTYYVGVWIEDDETVYKVQGRKADVLKRWLSRCDAHVSE